MAEDAGKKADGGVDDDGGAEFAAGENVVADGKLLIAKELADALVHTFVAAADENRAIERGEVAGDGLREGFSLRGEQDNGLFGGIAGGFRGYGDGVEAFEDGLGFEDHAFAAAEGPVVDRAVAVMRECAEVVRVNAGALGAKGAFEDAVAEDAGAGVTVAGWGAEEIGKDGEDVEVHSEKGRSSGLRWIFGR